MQGSAEPETRKSSLPKLGIGREDVLKEAEEEEEGREERKVNKM